MKKPEDIPDGLIEQARAAANAIPLTQNLSDEAMRAILAVAWDFVYGTAYTDGFSDKEMSEQDAEMLEKYGWSPHMLFWFEGATPEEAEALIEKMIEAGEDGQPEHINMAGVGSLSAGHRHTPKD